MMITAILILSIFYCAVSLSLPIRNLLYMATDMEADKFELAVKERRVPNVLWAKLITMTSVAVIMYILKLIAWTNLVHQYTTETIALVAMYATTLYICITLHNAEMNTKTKVLLTAGRTVFVLDILYCVYVLAT